LTELDVSCRKALFHDRWLLGRPLLNATPQGLIEPQYRSGLTSENLQRRGLTPSMSSSRSLNGRLWQTLPLWTTPCRAVVPWALESRLKVLPQAALACDADPRCAPNVWRSIVKGIESHQESATSTDMDTAYAQGY